MKLKSVNPHRKIQLNPKSYKKINPKIKAMKKNNQRSIQKKSKEQLKTLIGCQRKGIFGEEIEISKSKLSKSKSSKSSPENIKKACFEKLEAAM